jgi:tryptophan-rich sensory protein
VSLSSAALLTRSPVQQHWFIRLRRPLWLVHEKQIPLFGLAIDVCLVISAWLAWRSTTNWALMVAYLALWLVVQGRIRLICATRRLAYGSCCALIADMGSAALGGAVFSRSLSAALLLLPLLLWSPLDVVISRQMVRLHR